MRESRSSRRKAGISLIPEVLLSAVVVLTFWWFFHSPVSAIAQVVFGMAVMLTLIILTAFGLAVRVVAKDVRKSRPAAKIEGLHPDIIIHDEQLAVSYTPPPVHPKTIRGKVWINPPDQSLPKSGGG